MQTELEQLLKPTLEAMGYELWGCQYLARGGYALLRIYIDSANGIGIEDCERVSRQVSAVLDVEDPIAGEYRLEISSPGIPRPLFNADQYQRYIGQQVDIKLTKPLANQRNFSGMIVSADAQELVLDLGNGIQHFSFNTIAKAHLTSK